MESRDRESLITPELYFLISKFLSISPLEETKQALVRELEQHKILPQRIDWLGGVHDQSFEELERKYPHIGPRHLLEICSRIGPILDRELKSNVPNLQSLLGAGKQSLLRTADKINAPKVLLDYCTRIRGLPRTEALSRKFPNNIVRVVFGREHGGPIHRSCAVNPNFYEKQSLLRRTLGHLSAVYCVLFDRSGKYILTGADDLLVKLWSAIDGRLLATFRGASAEITDIAVNVDNSLLAAGSLDRILRVWDLQSTAPVAVLIGHTGMITSVNFCPSPRGDLRYLVTTSTDGSVAFWEYAVNRGKTTFGLKPTQYHEKIRPGQAQMICAAFSPGGIFLAAGSADHYVRVYLMSVEGPKRILETEAHSDTVDSIQWAHNGLGFISGSKDGTAHVWHFESQQWRSMKLNMAERLPTCPPPSDDGKRIKVTMVSWDYSDNWVMTAVNDFTIKVWNSKSGQLHKVLRGHTDELYVLESHPRDHHVLLSAGHDGQIFLWNVFTGQSIANFVNQIDGQGHGGVFDAKWSPDGTMIAATDSHGHILMFGFGSGHARLKILPTELFFHTDYRPLMRDSNHHVLDEQTQTMPHLMPPPFLVDVGGNPHHPSLQKLVPGRENCPTDQLIPNTGVGNEGIMEVQQPENNTVSELDRLIEALAQRRNPAPDSNNDRENLGGLNVNIPNMNGNNNNRIPNANSPRTPSLNRVGLRRSGDVEGVRQSSGNWQRDGSIKFQQSRCYVRPLSYAQLQNLKHAIYAAGHNEMEIYRREMRRRPLMINTSNLALLNSSRGGRPQRGRNRPVPNPAYRTRSIRVLEAIPSEEEDEEEDHVESNSSGGDSSDSTAMNEEELALGASSSSDTESSEYSDWVADQPGPNLEPPKRSKRKPVERRAYSPTANDMSGDNSRRSRKKKVPIPTENGGEIPESYRPPEWLSEVIPRKAPYYPQMGDEVVYLRQGHQRYLEAVRSKKVYKLSNNCEPWEQIEMQDHEPVKVIGIKYEIRPPRLCCLKLAIMNPDGSLTDNSFTIKYHDMPDVLDFLVLKQTFDMAVSRSWEPGDRFRCMIDDGWWMGSIESRTALAPEFPSSMFMCFRIRWDNGEFEFMSPWDMEPIDESRLPPDVGGAVPVLPEELRATLYQPKGEEWPRGDRDAACRRIIVGLEQVMGLAIADAFLAPVDLNIYPNYAFVIEYPIDISTIKARFENHFYRRITSAQFDVRYLATNAEKFNESHSSIVKNARIITDLCLRIIRDLNDIDVGAVYHQLMDTYISSDSDTENRPGPSTSAATTSRSRRSSRRTQRLGAQYDWRRECKEMLEMIWQCDDSSPFREPVDIIEHPDYNQIIDTPMDLLTIKEDLIGGNYQSPIDFVKDMRLIFENSKNYNTNKRSRIYSMTLRLSALFETHVRSIINAWKSSRKSKNKRNNVLNSSAEVVDPNQPGTSKMVTRATATNGGPSRQHYSSSDDDDDDDVALDSLRKYGTAASSSSAAATTSNSTRSTRRTLPSSTNGVSSSSMHEPGSSSIGFDPQEGASSSSRFSRTRNGEGSSSSRPVNGSNGGLAGQKRIRPERGSRTASQNDRNRTNSSDSSSDSSESDGSNGIPLSELGNSRRAARHYDSEESYKPSTRGGGGVSSRRRPKKKKKKDNKKPKSNSSSGGGGGTRKRPTRQNRPATADDDEEDDFEADDASMEVNPNDEESENSNEEDEIVRPKKRARPHESNGARASSRIVRHENYPRRENLRQSRRVESSTRNDDEEDDGSTDDSNAMNARKKTRYESDQSYHQERAKSRRGNRNLETESDDEIARPTRSSVRRQQLTWGQEEDDLEQEEEHEEEVEEPRPSRNSSARGSQRRTARQRAQVPDDSDDEEEVESRHNHSSSKNVSRESRFRAQHRRQTDHGGATSSSSRPSRRGVVNGINDEEGENDSDDDDDDDQPLQRSRRRTHSSNLTSSSSNCLKTRSGRVMHSGDTAEIAGPSGTSRFSRTGSITTTAIGTTQRQRMAPHEVDHNYGEQEPSSVRQSRRMNVILSRHQRNADELDPLQDRPAPSTSTAEQPSTSSSRVRATSTNSESTIVRRSYMSRSSVNARSHAMENETEINVDIEENVGEDPLSFEAGGASSSSRNTRSRRNEGTPERASTRKVRRMYYNEETDDEDYSSRPSRTSRRKRSGDGHGGEQPVVQGTEEDDEETADEDASPSVSVSSRGRVRKIIAKARGLFRE